MSGHVRDKMHGGGAILNTISIKQKIVDFKEHSLVVLLISKILYCHQYSADFTYFMALARELFLHYWLIFRENSRTRNKDIFEAREPTLAAK